jgi:hypothetical protein
VKKLNPTIIHNANNANNPNNPNNPIQMNHTNMFSNDVKFTGSAFEFPSDALTVLFQWATLLLIIVGLEERRN